MDFCSKNDKASEIKMNQMYEGITEEQIITTIQTILQMERNLKKS